MTFSLCMCIQDRQLVTANSQFFYSPMYRRYYGLTPPNPQLCNPRLLEDYIDWYINVYMEEELPWQWVRRSSFNIEYVNLWYLFYSVDQRW